MSMQSFGHTAPYSAMKMNIPSDYPAGASSDAQRIADLRYRLAVSRSATADRNRLMAVAGHDLKQPLQIISRALERLAPHASGPDDRMWARAAETQIVRLATGLTDLAMASRAKDDEVSRSGVRCFAISAVLNEVESGWCMEASARGLDLRFVHCSEIVRSDPRLLETILGNLVGNALKYTRSGRVVVGCRRIGSSISLQVADSGEGIAEADRDRIFRPFEQLDAQTDGLGLGLYLVRSLCDSLNHELSLESRLGVGTRFAVTLPRFRP
ncbi:sensor histidine kinase [Sphingomonas faeni]|uniref:sensor histidine kinase n=1 Tax=Sphingomonas faeni TaxID=185950 RepID=UPI00277E2A58|nr:HAMP domain-containing sensor histidine kinase [Sphingomonas faeni]MDQ0839294.1 signal transduction histidine kinase [Sphingomonas faeni]